MLLVTIEVEGAPDCRVYSWPRWVPGFVRRLSMTLAPFKRIYLADHIIESNHDPAPVMGHEATHYRRAWDHGPWRWLGRYVVDRHFRLDEEMWGEAAEAVARIQMRYRPTDDSEILEFISAKRLHGWQFPYFTGGRETHVLSVIAERVRAILDLM